MSLIPPPFSTPPAWLKDAIPWGKRLTSQKALLDLTLQFACLSAKNGGGPFGALIASKDGEIIEVGWNNVIESHDSTAHAEIHCLRRAQAKLKTHNLATTSHGPLVLYTSCAPCIQCFGAVYWSGLSAVISGGAKQHAEALGFDEGPVSEALWQAALEKKQISHLADLCSDEEAKRPFLVYREANGKIY